MNGKVIDIHNVQQYIGEYFAVHEFVGPRVYKKYGEKAWRFIDPRLLVVMYIIRTNLGRKITANNWYWGGRFKERGLRVNIGAIVMGMVKKMILYLSSHIRGAALDFDVEGMTSKQVRLWIIENAHLFPFKIRLEKGVSWNHLDVDDEPSNPTVYLF